MYSQTEVLRTRRSLGNEGKALQLSEAERSPLASPPAETNEDTSPVPYELDINEHSLLARRTCCKTLQWP